MSDVGDAVFNGVSCAVRKQCGFDVDASAGLRTMVDFVASVSLQRSMNFEAFCIARRLCSERLCCLIVVDSRRMAVHAC